MTAQTADAAPSRIAQRIMSPPISSATACARTPRTRILKVPSPLTWPRISRILKKHPDYVSSRPTGLAAARQPPNSAAYLQHTTQLWAVSGSVELAARSAN